MEFWCFGLPAALGVGGWVYGGGGCLGGAPHTRAHARTCTHAHAHTCARGKHDNFMQMAAPIGEIPGNSLWCHMHVRVCVHACTCMCMCVRGTLSPPPPTSTHPPPPRGGTPRINQNSIALELIEIFQFRLKIWNLWRLPHPWVGVWFSGWVGGWVGGLMGGVRSKHKKFKNCWLNQDNSILFEDLWFVETPPPMGGCVGGWVGQWVNGWGQVKWLTIE